MERFRTTNVDAQAGRPGRSGRQARYRVDFSGSVGQITAAVADGGAVAHSDRSELDYLALELFEGLWRLDFVAVEVGKRYTSDCSDSTASGF